MFWILLILNASQENNHIATKTNGPPTDEFNSNCVEDVLSFNIAAITVKSHTVVGNQYETATIVPSTNESNQTFLKHTESKAFLVNWDCNNNIIHNALSELFVTFKQHVTCSRPQRENVAMAAHTLSNVTATALRRHLLGAEAKLARDVAGFLEIIHDWFAIMNTYSPIAKIPTMKAFGQNLHIQNNLLNNVNDMMENMTCIGKKCVIMSTKSLQDLYADIKSKYGIEYISTHRLHQDYVQNLLSPL